jgi:hypothetical protein
MIWLKRQKPKILQQKNDKENVATAQAEGERG